MYPFSCHDVYHAWMQEGRRRPAGEKLVARLSLLYSDIGNISTILFGLRLYISVLRETGIFRYITYSLASPKY